ncbi:hypothetical protein N0X72_00900 [Streptomyces carpaticus]|uniref:hypothetical protein n=1 Tax=Streptomyces carpaticus TaxID=285558 RepID=UPI0021FB266D|nr:hypothetical protein N0X72_00900 [Streptomyces carpaticus]
MLRNTLIVFDRDNSGLVMADPRSTGQRGELDSSVIHNALQQSGFVKDPATGFYRQRPDIPLYEQLHQAAHAMSVLTHLGYGVRAEQNLLASHILLVSPAARVQQLSRAFLPSDAARLIERELVDEGGLFPQLIRFLDEAAQITSRHQGPDAREATARLASAAVVLRSMHTALAGIETQVSSLGHPQQPHRPGPVPGADRPRHR